MDMGWGGVFQSILGEGGIIQGWFKRDLERHIANDQKLVALASINEDKLRLATYSTWLKWLLVCTCGVVAFIVLFKD